MIFLRKLGARILVEHSVTESYSGDGLIVASFRPEDSCFPLIKISRNFSSNSLFRELEYDLNEAWLDIERAKIKFEVFKAENNLKLQKMNTELEALQAERNLLCGRLNDICGGCVYK